MSDDAFELKVVDVVEETADAHSISFEVPAGMDEQFYVDQADIAPEMVERFEFEVDTTKANEYWHEEVADNLRKKAEEDGDPHAAGSDSESAAESPQIMSGT